MTNYKRSGTILALVGALLLNGAPLPVLAQDTPPADNNPPADTPPADTPPGGNTPAPASGVNGQLIDLDGKTPVPGKEVRILDAKTGNPMMATRSAEDGSFQLPALGEGSYVLETDGVSQVFQVTAAQPLTNLKILVPAAARRRPLAGGTAPTPTASGVSSWIWIGAGAALVVAGLGVGTWAVVDNNNDDDYEHWAHPALFLDPQPSGNYGAHEINSVVQRTFILKNTTNQPIDADLTLTSTTQFEFQTNNAPIGPLTFTVPAQGFVLVPVTFIPTVAGNHMTTLTATYTFAGRTLTTSRILVGVGLDDGASPSPFVP